MWSGGEFRGGVGRACISEVALEAHDVSLQVGCHVVICVEIRLGHWMWYLDQIYLAGCGGCLERKSRQTHQARSWIK